MSKSSIAAAPKIPTQLPPKSAWSRGPPQAASLPSPRSQSPAPSTPVHPTHSRRPSNLGQGVPIKDGVSISRGNVGAVKQNSAVTFGSIDDVSAPISSSPAAAPPIKSEGVRSFGSVPATGTSGHVNGRASISSISSVQVPASASAPSSTSSTPATATAIAAPPKPGKVDIKKLFQTPSSAPSSHPPSDTSSPSVRPAALPPQQPQPSQTQPPPSQPSQLGSQPFTPFVPGAGMRPQQNNGPGGPPRSPVYNRMPNGNGPRSQGGPNVGPSQLSAGLSSPRLGPHPHNGQPSGMPPPPPQMQPQMQQQMPVPGWPGYYYQEHYMQPYATNWYMPPQAPHQHPQHHPPPPVPHGPPHGMPMSPRNPQPPLQGSGTPTLSHAAVNTVHAPHPPPPLSHSSASVNALTSPPPTPSTTSMATGRLNANSNAFVPNRPTKVTLKKQDGTEIDIEQFKSSPQPSSAAAITSPPQGSAFRQGSPGTPNRRPMSIRMETEDQRKKRLQEEEAKEKEKIRQKEEAEEKVRKEKEEEERKQKEQEELKKREEEEAQERLKKEEEEKERIKKEEEERQRRLEEEQVRLKMEEEERIKREAEEEAERQRIAEEEKTREQARLQQEEEERQRREEEEAAAAKLRTASPEPSTQPETVAELTIEDEKKDDAAEEEFDVATTSIVLKDETRERAKELLRINTAAALSAEPLRRRPGPLDLSNTKSISAPLPSALATARIIDDINSVSYPVGVMSPKAELNTNAKDGKFRYDRDFLLQFMSICREKPDMLPPLDAIGLEPVDPSSLQMSRGGSGRHRQASGVAPSRQPINGLNFAPSSNFNKPGANPFNNFGNFSTLSSKLSSEERYAIATGSRSASVSSAAGIPFNRPSQMQRTASQGGPGGAIPNNRTRSKRGEKRGENNKAPNMGGQQNHGGMYGGHQNNAQNLGFEPVVPLQMSANRWDRKSLAAEPDSPELVDRKVKALLNKLTMEKFDSISDQIITWANKSEKEKDGRTLIQVIRLVFEKATDEATWSEMYARLCRKMMEQISAKVQDDGIKNPEGKPITGGQLFRKYLLNRCQEDFERGWVQKEATAAAAATKALEDQAAKAANEKNKEGGEEEVALYSEEYYAAQKAKRQGLGLIKFIGELFKLQMLTERIMHECVKKLLGNVENPEEEEIESLCKLLSTVGAILDTQKARAHMDVYFSRMKELTKSLNVSSRMQFMLQDVIELRERKWVSRNAIAAPATIAQIHEAAAKEKAVQEKESYQRQISMSRGGSRRGNDRSEFSQIGPDGWAVAGSGSGPPRPPPKAGDLSHFGKISKAQPMTFGPSSVFAGKKGEKREALSRTNSNSNMFSMLQNTDTSGDSAKGALEPAQRRRLVLQPRSIPPAGEQPAPSKATGSDSESEDDQPLMDEPAVLEMTEEQANKKISEDSKEFFAVRNFDEAETYFSALPAQHHHILVGKLTSFALESKEADATLVAGFFARASSKELCSAVEFETGFMEIAEFIDDIAIDAPMAFQLFANIIKGAGLDEERRQRLASKSMDSDKLLALVS